MGVKDDGFWSVLFEDVRTPSLLFLSILVLVSRKVSYVPPTIKPPSQTAYYRPKLPLLRVMRATGPKPCSFGRG
jgi:hypothetical protein